MTKAGALNFFGIVRAFALAMIVIGLVLFALVFAATFLGGPLQLMMQFAVPGALGLVTFAAGIVLALVCTVTRLFVARMRFVSDAPRP